MMGFKFLIFILLPVCYAKCVEINLSLTHTLIGDLIVYVPPQLESLITEYFFLQGL